MIVLNKVHFSYGNDQGNEQEGVGVNNINLRVNQGECVVLCGRSGSGKSTLLRLMSGLAPGFFEGFLQGEVRVNHKQPAAMPPEERAETIGVVFQDPRSQFFMEKVRDELAFSAENLGFAPDEIRERIKQQAEMFGISHLLDRSLNKLSSGQKQRVAIASASILAPPLLILDEPTANLDERATKDIVELLGRLKQNGTTLIISEHRLHPLLSIADSFVCMEQGKLARIWSKEQFSQLSYADVRPYGLRHPEMAKTGAEPEVIRPAEPAIQGRNLAFRYNKSGEGIDGMDIMLPKGSVIALTGENGAGKTTLCKIMCGLLRQRSGTVSSSGIPLSAGRRRESSYLVMQDADYQLYADSVGNEIVLGRRLNERLRTRAYEALEAFGLEALRDRHPASLSGGEKQRVTMAAAYCSDAELVVLDEPTSGLDGDGVLQVAAWTRKLARTGKTVVIITHDSILTKLACDHVVEMKRKGGTGELKSSKKQGMARLLELAGEKKALMIWAGILSTVSVFFLLVPYISVYMIMAEILSHASNISAVDGSYLFKWAGRGAAGMVLGYFFMYVGGMLGHIAAFRTLYRIRVKLSEHIGALPLGYFTKNATGKIKKIVEQDVEKIEMFIAHQLPDFINTAAMIVVMIAVMFTLNPWLALASVIPLLIGFFVQYSMMAGKKATVGLKEYFDALENINASSTQYVRGMPSIKIFGQTVHSFRKFYDDIIKYRDFCIQYADNFQTGYVSFKVIVLSLATFIVPVGLLFISREPNDIAFAITLMFFLVMTPGITTPVFKLSAFASTVNTISEGVRRIDKVMKEQVLEEPQTGRKPASFDIKFHNVSFSYDIAGGREALSGVCLSAPQGQITALVGPSGSGKSTLAQLIPRFWDVQKGRITIGGIDIRNIKTNDLMESMSFVFQDTFLFSDTIFNNIAAGRPTATKEEVYAAAGAAQCHRFIERLPKGYDTLIGEGGVYLSGGEEQRIAVARAILKNSPILVLDEATAYADPENEYQMQLALQELIKGKTVLIIAHRLQTICGSDQIIVMKEGRIDDQGTHKELLSHGGLYKKMWEAYTSSTDWQIDPAREKEALV